MQGVYCILGANINLLSHVAKDIIMKDLSLVASEVARVDIEYHVASHLKGSETARE